MWLNRGKESVVLDLTSLRTRRCFEAMLAKADVFVQNLKPGAVARLGFALDRLRATIRDWSSARCRAMARAAPMRSARPTTC